MGVYEVSMYLDVSVVELKNAIYHGGLIRGVAPPPVHMVTPYGRLVFLGQDVRKAYERLLSTSGCASH